MKPDICENCGGNSFREQEDAYVCEYCDTYFPKRSLAVRTEGGDQTERDGKVHVGEVDPPKQTQQPQGNKRPISKWVSFVLCLLLGYYGIHKFYEGRIAMGVVYLLTGGLFGIGWLVDIILILLKPDPYYV